MTQWYEYDTTQNKHLKNKQKTCSYTVHTHWENQTNYIFLKQDTLKITRCIAGIVIAK